MAEYGSKPHIVWVMSAGDQHESEAGKKGDDATSHDRDSKTAAAIKHHWDVGLRALELVSIIDNSLKAYQLSIYHTAIASGQIGRYVDILRIFWTFFTMYFAEYKHSSNRRSDQFVS